ncbi:MAG: ATP-binding cassette, subfamily multidrug efflux pump [Actinomycetota bacterium]|nr:ATP-binding cassette, subfamily multidrug efflux pump [Actinomycetota bacterium]
MNQLLVTYLRPHRKVLVVIALLLLIQAVANLYLPSLNADIINEGVVTGDTGYILRVGGLMLLLSVLLGIASVVTVYFSARTSMRFGREVRGDLFRHVEGFSLSQMHSFGVPSLITRNTNDVQQLQMLVMVGLTMMVLAPITAIGGVIMAMRENVQLSSLLIVTVPLMIAVIGFMLYRAIPLFRAMQVKIDRVNGVLRENLAGIRVIRAFVRTSHEEERFAEANVDLTDTALKVTRLFALIMPTLMLIMNLTIVATIWFGGHLIADGSMPIGNLFAFQSYIMQILTSVMMAVMTMMMVPRASASAERIQAVLQAVPEIAEPAIALDVPLARIGRIELRDVDFRYPGAQDSVLNDVSLTLEPGTTTAIVGGTGSGKSTLVNLLPRLLDVTGGSVLIDGVDVRDIPLEELWDLFGLVPQRGFLFGGTVGSNVRFGRPDATDDEVWDALTVAQAREFVDLLPEGLDAPIDQGGVNLSGGQRQRLAIARCIVRDPLIYLFDDSFSALDYATDARLRGALRSLTRGKTVVIVAQRVSTIMDADRIVVLDNGRVAGIGTHDDLMETCEAYREIAASQVSLEDVR